MYECLLVMVGGALGALTRYGFTKLIAVHPFPWSTLVVNILGSFLIGLCTSLIIKYTATTLVVRHLVIIGFLGSLTTFSTFSLDLLKLLENGQLLYAFSYLAFSILLGLSCAWIGLRVVS